MSGFRLLSLPPELVAHILSLPFSKTTLLSISLVSRLLRSLIAPVLFRDLVFSAAHGLDMVSAWKTPRYLRPLSTHPFLSSIRHLCIRIGSYDFVATRRSRPLDISKQIQYLSECVKMLEGRMIERFELRLWGDPRLMESGKWATNFINELAESLNRYESLKEVSVDLSFQYSVKDDMRSSALLLDSLSQQNIEELSLGVPGPLDMLLIFPTLNEKRAGVFSSANLKHLTLSIAHNLFDVVARVSSLPPHLLTLKIINRHGYSLDFNFLHALLFASASSLKEIQIDDFGADIETFNYVSTPIPFRQLHTLTLRADNNRRVGVMKENPDFFVRSFEDCPVKIINVALPEGVDTKLVEELRRRKQRGMLQVWTRIVDVGGVGGFPGAKEETLEGLRALGVEVDLGVGMDLGLVKV